MATACTISKEVHLNGLQTDICFEARFGGVGDIAVDGHHSGASRGCLETRPSSDKVLSYGR